MQVAHGHKPSFPALEEKLAVWMQVSWQNVFAVTRTNIHIRMGIQTHKNF